MNEVELNIVKTHDKCDHYANCHSLLRLCMATAPSQGLLMEFGVCTGDTIRFMADTLKHRIFYGFDSFRGLPEDWNDVNPKGMFDTDGKPPFEAPENVKLVIGMFQDTLPDFLATHDGEVAFVHLDADLYSSTSYVLKTIGSRFANGAVLNFNEFWGYDGADQHEYKALLEFLTETGYQIEPLGRSGERYSQAAFILRK